MQEFSTIVPAALIGVGFAAQIFVQWRLSTNKGNADAAQNWKAIAESEKARSEQLARDYKDEVAQLRSQLNEHSEKLGHMKAMIEEKDKQLKEYLEILQERDPDSKRMAENVVVLAKDVQQIKAQVGSLHEFLLAKTVEKMVVPPGSPQGTTI